MRFFRFLFRWGAAPPRDFGDVVQVRGVFGPVAIDAVYSVAAQIRGVK